MSFDDYKVVLYRNQPEGWVAEIPAVPGCYALMPTRDQALAELAGVFGMISAEYLESGRSLPVDTTELVSAWRSCGRVPPHRRSARFSSRKTDRQPREMGASGRSRSHDSGTWRAGNRSTTVP
jgi:predicted RNase H-like HicB family nuclease